MMPFIQNLKQTALGSVLVVVGLLNMTSISLAQGDAWTYKAGMHSVRAFFGGGIVDGKIYIIGGAPNNNSVISAVEMYDPATNTWSPMAGMPAGRCSHATCAFHGKIYVFGGLSPSPYGTANKNVYEYNPQTDTWIQKADMPYANANCGIAVVNDIIYLIGGSLSASSPPYSTVMAYNPVTESWTQKADMPTARVPSACVVDGKIYAIGGTTENWQVFSYKLVEVYDPSTDTWARKSDMPTERWGLGTCVVDGKIFAIGGWSGSRGVCTTNEVYDPITDTWTTKSPIQQKRNGAFVCSIGDKIYAMGGAYAVPQVTYLSSMEEYNPGTTNVEEGSETTVIPSGYALYQNYPNPFNPQTRIKYELPHAGKVVLKVYNIVGELICTLVDEVKPAGSFEVFWNGRDNTGHRVAGGVYLYQLEVRDFVLIRKMLLLE
jgi:N-acetylneuraminic acid mutarotase